MAKSVFQVRLIKDQLFSRPFAQMAWGIIRAYAGNDPKPDGWKKEHDYQVEFWLVNDATMMKE